MQLSTIFSRAWAQKYLEPGERAVLKFVNSFIILIPSTAIISGVVAVLHWTNVSVPGWVWSVLVVVIPPFLFALAKWFSAQGDTNVGNAILVAEAAATPVLQQGPTAITMPQPPK